MRLFAALGAGDIVAAYRAQIDKSGSDQEIQYPFSGQLLEYCREQRIETLALSYNPRVDSIQDGSLKVENRPRWLDKRGGLAYHLSRIAYAVVLAARARRFRAEFAIIDSGSAHYFALSLFRFLGIPVAVNFHNVLWPNGYKPEGAVARAILWLDGCFFSSVAAGILGVSPECGRQVKDLSGPAVPFFEFRSQYRIGDIISPAQARDRTLFRVLYVGRIEKSKGVLDIPAIAQQVGNQINFDICGGGGALVELKQIVAEQKLGNVFVHGRVSRSELLDKFSKAHAIIVPTRSTFCEGMPAVCAEAVQAGLPIITSRLSNAIPVLGEAIIEAQPESIESYASAILTLAGDRRIYGKLQNACPDCARQFFDRSKSYPAAIDRLMVHVFPKWKKLDSYEPIFVSMSGPRERVGPTD